MNWTAIVAVVAAGLLVWMAVRMVRGNPTAFSKESLGKSVYTMGLLAIMLIVVVGFCVLMLKS